MSKGFYQNNMLSFDYQKPYLIVNINGQSIKKEEWNISKLVLNKFYNIKKNNKPINFGYIFIYNKFNILNISQIKNLINLFKHFDSRNKEQVFGCSIIINKHLKGISNLIPSMLTKRVPTKFVDNLVNAKYFLNNIEKKITK